MALLQNLVPFLDDVNVSLIVRKWKDREGKLFVMLVLKPHKALKTPPFDKAVTLKAWGTAEEIERELTSNKVQTQISEYKQTVVELGQMEAANAAGKKALGKKDPPAAKEEKVKPAAKATKAEPKAATPKLMALMLVMTEIEDLEKAGEDGWKGSVQGLASEFITKAKEAIAEAPLSDAVKDRAKKVKDIIANAKQYDIV